MPTETERKAYLDTLVAQYEQPNFITNDPISIPHAFDDPRDQEVIGLYAALLAWGRRVTIMNKMADLCERMQYKPFAFVQQFDANRDGHRLDGFIHRTFQPVDALWLTQALSEVLSTYGSLGNLFMHHLPAQSEEIEPAIEGFSQTILSILPDTPVRLRKHVARPSTGSACKRLNMYVRWMVRPGPVDFSIWKGVKPSQLMLPLDVHCGTQARRLGILARPQNDWRAVQELTQQCRQLCPEDPVRYDFAFFGLGVTGDAPDPRFVSTSS